MQKQNAICKTRAQYTKRNCAFELFKVHCAATTNAKNASFHKKILKCKIRKGNFNTANSYFRKIRTRVFRSPSAGLNHHAIRAVLETIHHTNAVIKVVIKVASKILKRKERNCAFENLSLRCGAIKKSLRTCPSLGVPTAHANVVSMYSCWDAVQPQNFASQKLQYLSSSYSQLILLHLFNSSYVCKFVFSRTIFVSAIQLDPLGSELLACNVRYNESSNLDPK